jgi:hypothetical protein
MPTRYRSQTAAPRRVGRAVFAAGAGRCVRLQAGSLWLAALLIGCGARALADAPSDEEEFGASGAAGRGGAGGRGGDGTSGVGAAPTIDPTAPIDPGVTLPECELGFSMSAAGSRPCTYLYQGNCYDDPLMACACACQSFAANRGCIIGGFLNTDDPQTVSCVQR